MDNFKSYANVGIEGGIISPSSTTINQAIYDMCKYIKENAKQGYSIINVQCNKVNTLGLVDYYNLVIDTNEPKTFTYTFTVTNGEKGDRGDTGYYINNVTINKISSQGLIDTYKISFSSTSGDTYEIEFNVTNGKSFNWMGEWIADNEYREDDVVYYNGSSYICKSDIIGSEITPDNDTANWSVMCKQGIQGEKGEAATIKIGTVTTLPAGSQATVVNVGDENNAVFDFGIPQGTQGEKGETNVVANPTAVTDNQLAVLAINGTNYNVTRAIIALDSEGNPYSSRIAQASLSVGASVTLFGIANYSSFNNNDVVIVRFSVYKDETKIGTLITKRDTTSPNTFKVLAVIYDQTSGGDSGGRLTKTEIPITEKTDFVSIYAAIKTLSEANDIVSVEYAKGSEGGVEVSVVKDGITTKYAGFIPQLVWTNRGELQICVLIIQLDEAGTPTGEMQQATILYHESTNPVLYLSGNTFEQILADMQSTISVAALGTQTPIAVYSQPKSA